MSWAPNYASSADLKAYLRITNTDDDVEILYALEAASRVVDQHCDRQFGNLSAAAARYYGPRVDRRQSRWFVPIDDLMTTTSLVVKTDDGGGAFATTLTINDDFRLYPWNAAADGRPWTALALDQDVTFTQGSSQSFLDRAIEVTAIWGWTAVPDVVVQATLIQAARFFKRRDASFGIAGSPEVGSEMRLLSTVDPDVAVLLDPVRRNWGVL